MAQIEEIARETPGVAHTVGISGQSLILNANAPNLGSMYVMLDEFDERPAPGLSRRRHRRRAARSAAAERDARTPSSRRSAPPPIDGPGHDRRLQAHRRGPRQPRPGELAAQTERPIVAGATRPPGLQRRVQQLRAPTRRGSTWTSTAPSAMALGVPVERRLQTRCRSTSAPTTSTTSTSSAGPGRSTSRPTRRSATGSRTSGSSRCATTRGRWSGWARCSTSATRAGPVMVMRYNMYSAAADHRQRAPGTSSGAGDRS